MIDGYCLGGGLELVLACDFRVASERSDLGLPEVNLGIFPAGGGVQYVTRLVGPSAAKDLCMTGEQFSANRAADLGLIDRVYSDESFETSAAEFVERLASSAPLALRAIKESVDRAVIADIDRGRAQDQRLATTLMGIEDAGEGAAAFREDRAPSFEGR